MRKVLATLVRDEEGQNLVEYALIGALVAVAAVVAMTNLGSAIVGTFNKVMGALPQ